MSNFDIEKTKNLYLDLVDYRHNLNSLSKINQNNFDKIKEIEEEIKIINNLCTNLLKTIQFYLKNKSKQQTRKDN